MDLLLRRGAHAVRGRRASARRASRVRGTARLTLLLLVLLSGGTARADRRELYTVLGYEPGVARYELPVAGAGSATSYAATLTLSAYYGLSNTFHLGGRLRLARNPDVHFGGAVVRMPDGSRSLGDVYEDDLSLGIGALALYRFDTRTSLAPVAEVEAGFTSHQFQRIEHIPAGATHTIPERGVSRVALYGAAALLVEYRFRDRWVAAAGIALQGEGGGLMPLGVRVPVRVGVIW